MYGSTRDLLVLTHSFPKRRSSDRQWRRLLRLPAPRRRGAAAMLQPAHDGAVAAEHLYAVDAEGEVVGPVTLRPGAARHHQRPGDERRRLAGPAGDRKSTRLNSSH